MKILFKNILILLFFILLIANTGIFVSGMHLGDDINRFEDEIKKLDQENTILEKEVYRVESLQYAASLSAKLNFVRQSQPLYFENLKYALNR
jgi:hypothetical protein